MTRKHGLMTAAAIGLGVLALPAVALADDGVSPGLFAANNVWMMLAAGLVFIMHLGFATLETGHRANIGRLRRGEEPRTGS